MPANCASVKAYPQLSSTDAVKIEQQERTTAYIVQLSAPSATGADTAKIGDDGTNSVPAIGTAYGTTGLKLMTKRAELMDPDRNRVLYKVTCTFGNDTVNSSGGGSLSQAPWDRPKLFDYDSIEYAMDMEKDNSSPRKPVVNSAGDPIRLPTSRSNTLITVRFAKTSFTYATAAALRGTVNSAQVTINGVAYAAGTCRLLGVSASQATYTDANGAGTDYYQILYRIEQTDWPDLFDAVVLDRGYRQKVGSNYKVCTTLYIDADGNTVKDPKTNKDLTVPVSEPVLLDGSGAQLAAGGTPVYLTFKPFAAASWSALSLT